MGARLLLLLLLLLYCCVSSCDGGRWGRRRGYSGGGGWPSGGLDDLGIGLICMVVAVALFVICCNCWYYGCCDALFESDDQPRPKNAQQVRQALTSGQLQKLVFYELTVIGENYILENFSQTTHEGKDPVLPLQH